MTENEPKDETNENCKDHCERVRGRLLELAKASDEYVLYEAAALIEDLLTITIAANKDLAAIQKALATVRGPLAAVTAPAPKKSVNTPGLRRQLWGTYPYGSAPLRATSRTR